MAVFIFTIFLSLGLEIMSNVIIYNNMVLSKDGTRPVIRDAWLFNILPLTAIHGSRNMKHETRGKNYVSKYRQ